ncbi:MAG: MBL fold metallo-hydrolase [Betaproteobacteria bacterium]|nr:MBL fold metallo-hydrolase [Betaproteobacteria bacterium]
MALFRAAGLLLGLCGAAHAAILPAPTQVSAHAWAWIGPYEGPAKINNGFRMNLGFVVGRDAVAVIDTGYTTEMAEEMVAAIGRVTPLPIRFAINTNSQPHRFMGNEVFRRSGARVIASVDAAARMAKDGGDFAQGIASALERKEKPDVPSAPDQLVAEQGVANIDLGGVKLEITHIGRAHTGGSLVIRVSPDRIVYAGDVLYAGRLPAVLPDSNLTGWIAAFERLRSFDAAAFVPGHGQPGSLATFEQPTLAYLKAVNFAELSDRNAITAYLESEREGF